MCSVLHQQKDQGNLHLYCSPGKGQDKQTFGSFKTLCARTYVKTDALIGKLLTFYQLYYSYNVYLLLC